MNLNYKIILSNKNLYREVAIPVEITELHIGTQTGCEVRLHKDLFFETIELTLVNRNGSWSLLSADNLYIRIAEDDVRKLRTTELHHGDVVSIYYQDSDQYVFQLEFVIDFDEIHHQFNRYADCSGRNNLVIGSRPESHILLSGDYIRNDQIELVRNGNGFRLYILDTSYGVLHNGKKAVDQEQIENGDFFSISDKYFYIKNNRVWTENDPDIVFRNIPVYDSVNRGSYPRFQRSSRIKIAVNDEKIPILDPAQKPQKPKNNLLLRLLPSVGMLLAAVLMATMGSSMMFIFSGVSVACAAITAVLTLRNNNKEYKENLEERTNTYHSYIEKKKTEISGYREEEKQVLNEIYISQELEKNYIHQFSPNLFDRSAEDEDFLCVRIGTGRIPAKRQIDYKKQEKLEPGDELQQIPELLQQEYKYVYDAPVVCDLKNVNAIGILGAKEYRFEMMKNFVIDLAARQYHSDVAMVFVAKEKHKEKVRWLRFLPNVWNSSLGIRNLVMDDESKTAVFEYLYKELTMREQNKSFANHIVVFLYDEYGFQKHPVSRFVKCARELGVTFVFFGNSNADVPMGCDALIFLQDSQNGYLVNAADRTDNHSFVYPTLSMKHAERIVQLLAPICTDEVSLEGDLTKNISLFELLNILAADDLNLTARWQSTNVTKSMAAPLGVSKTGLISLDLHDKAHGPHGLVAGTTGSGKSEILQTYILAMATLYHPYEVGFVIIDFKGGGMANQFADLPHLMGAITNIDGKEIDRSLKSIKAELQKRQRLFAEAEVNHIDKYIQKFKAGEAAVALPHLIIIVDEFAELKAEQPDFMKELISAARIGRSLGVHLILATQKPAGQVNEQIWSNSRFKLCLKVQDKNDSNEVLKSPLAAEIKEPGRAYLQVGYDEIFELFQSAYSGAPEDSDSGAVREFEIIQLTDSGKRLPVYVQKKSKTDKATRTQLEAIVDYVHGYCEEQEIQKLPDICLPSLPETLVFPDSEKTASMGIWAEIGVYDDPDAQYQGCYSLDFSSANVMIIGSAQTGKTNLLQTIIRSLATHYTPDEVTVYIIDFSSMILKNFEHLKHVGGVVCPQDDEKLKNLFKMLSSEIESRKAKLMSVGVSSFAAYREGGFNDLPQIVLLIDNVTALKEMYFQDDDELLSLCREGLTVGVSVVIANAQTTGIGYRYLSNFSSRIALFCNDQNEYSYLFDHCRERLDNIPGRCLVQIEKHHLECQIYLAFEGEKEISRVNSINTFINEINGLNQVCAREIPLIPDILEDDSFITVYRHLMNQRFQVVAGLDYSTVMPFVLNLANLGLLGISGKEHSGRHNFVKYLLETTELIYPRQIKAYLVDGISKSYASIREHNYVCRYSFLPADAAAYIKEIEQTLEERYEEILRGNETVLETSDLLMLVIDSMDAVMAICNDSTALEAYKNIVGKYKNMNVGIIVSCIDNVNISYTAPEILKNLRDYKHILFFDDMKNLKLFDIPLSLTREYKKKIDIGDAYYFNDSECLKLKTPHYNENANR